MTVRRKEKMDGMEGRGVLIESPVLGREGERAPFGTSHVPRR